MIFTCIICGMQFLTEEQANQHVHSENSIKNWKENRNGRPSLYYTRIDHGKFTKLKKDKNGK